MGMGLGPSLGLSVQTQPQQHPGGLGFGLLGMGGDPSLGLGLSFLDPSPIPSSSPLSSGGGGRGLSEQGERSRRAGPNILHGGGGSSDGSAFLFPFSSSAGGVGPQQTLPSSFSAPAASAAAGQNPEQHARQQQRRQSRKDKSDGALGWSPATKKEKEKEKEKDTAMVWKPRNSASSSSGFDSSSKKGSKSKSSKPQRPPPCVVPVDEEKGEEGQEPFPLTPSNRPTADSIHLEEAAAALEEQKPKRKTRRGKRRVSGRGRGSSHPEDENGKQRASNPGKDDDKQGEVPPGRDEASSSEVLEGYEDASPSLSPMAPGREEAEADGALCPASASTGTCKAQKSLQEGGGTFDFKLSSLKESLSASSPSSGSSADPLEEGGGGEGAAGAHLEGQPGVTQSADARIPVPGQYRSSADFEEDSVQPHLKVPPNSLDVGGDGKEKSTKARSFSFARV
eukprot:Cvel_8714.t1-p1 / transcript=Cvel_8714.t1 / gene=Cvel_8714 / organism=Chromera_velia_CCMP2878 / gene_product=hypothetical protein / transcript_product=hypothetical protein / location=Cvel_scaffold486:82946-84298(-) / protein_length=451 / sequence_SO=supercontig / SO=protein_coding / is_pseudo=false